MTRCDQMKKGELYGCDHCGFEFQVTKEARHFEEQSEGACALDMTCCSEPMVLRGHGAQMPEGAEEVPAASPVYGG